MSAVPVCITPTQPDQLFEVAPEYQVRSSGLPCAAKQYRYMYGDCYLLAQAVWALTGWQALTTDSINGGGGHAQVELPNGLLLDAEGLHDRNDPADPIRVHERLELGVREDPAFPFHEWCLPDILADARELLHRIGWSS